MRTVDFFLYISLILNFLLGWYIVQFIKRVLNFQESLDIFVEKLKDYEGHLDIIYNLERFYGDEHLSNLLNHSKDIITECQQLQIINNYVEEDFEEKLGLLGETEETMDGS